jgi:hypothetical protein
MAADGLKHHIRRDFSVGGVKATDQSCVDGKLILEALLQHGIDYVQLLMGQNLESTEHITAAWIHDVSLLAGQKHGRHFVTLYEPESVARDIKVMDF